MKLKMLIGSVVLLLAIPALIHAQNTLAKVKIYPDSKTQRADIFGLLGIDHFMPTRDGGIEAEISQADLKLLKRSNYRYTILVPDVSKWLDSVNRIYYRERTLNSGRVAFEQDGDTVGSFIKKPADFQVKSTFSGYYTFAEMEDAIDTLVAKYPTIASKQAIDTTLGGDTLWVVKISDNVALDESEPEAFFMGLQHPREAITGASMIFFMQYLCEQYSKNTKVKELVDSREIFIMPCFNPDGYNYNYTSTSGVGGGSWRKNRHKFGSNYGVDLNRNWGVDWGNCGAPIQGNAISCGSNSAVDDTYYGPSAFSERETSAVRAFAKTHHFKTAFDQHAYGPYYSLPFGRQSLHNTAGTDMSPKDSAFYKVIPALMGKYNGMRAADSYDALGYEVAGGFKDWMLFGEIGVGTKDSVWAMTGEGAAGGGTPAYGSMSNFWAPASQIVTLCKSMTYQNIQLALAAGSYADLQDASDISLTAKTGFLSFRLQRIGITSGSYTVSILPMQNLTAIGAPVVIPALTYYQVYNGSISYTLPAALTNGQAVKYVLQVQTGGITYSDTITKFYNPTTMFTDNMEGTFGTNWQNTATTGASGFGYNYTTAGSFVFTTSGGYSSTKALSESAAGTSYTTRTRSIAQCKTVFNLIDATAAYLTFMVRHRAENFRDKLQVQISTDNTNWTAVNGKTTIREAGVLDDASIGGQPSLTGVREMWTPEVFNLDAFRGNTQVYLRFVFTSDDDPSGFKFEVDDGFYIDDVKLLKSTTTLVTLPTSFLNFNGILLPNKTVDLQWNTSANGNHSYYEIERSTDGFNFQTIGTVSINAPTRFIDAQPTTGMNYYRLRQVDRDGQMVYSKIISVNLKPQFTLTIYPNPATDVVNLQLSSDKAAKLNVQFTDVSGRHVYAEQVHVTNGSKGLQVDIGGWASQVYLVKVTDEGGQTISTQRFLKN